METILGLVGLFVGVFVMAVPAFADGLPCDVVHQRLERASGFIGLDISIVLTPGEKIPSVPNDEAWSDTVSGHDGKKYSVDLHCVYDKFMWLGMEMSPTDGPAQPKTDMVAAAIYAVTGWPTNKVMATAADVVRKQPHSLAEDDETLDLPFGLELKFVKHLTIGPK